MTHLEVFSWPVQKKGVGADQYVEKRRGSGDENGNFIRLSEPDRLTDNARTAVVELPTAADAKSTAGQATAADAEAVAATGKGGS